MACPTSAPPAVSETTSYCTWYITALISAYVIVSLVLFLLHHKHKYLVANKHYPMTMHDQLATEVYLKFWTGHRLAIAHIDHIYSQQDTLQFDYDKKYVTDPQLKDPPTVIVTPQLCLVHHEA